MCGRGAQKRSQEGPEHSVLGGAQAPTSASSASSKLGGFSGNGVPSLGPQDRVTTVLQPCFSLKEADRLRRHTGTPGGCSGRSQGLRGVSWLCSTPTLSFQSVGTQKMALASCQRGISNRALSTKSGKISSLKVPKVP